MSKINAKINAKTTNVPKNKRADFSDVTRNALAKASGYRCCNPTCRQNVFINNKIIGQISHIIAASKNGPRASENFEKNIEKIKSTSNGLLLCHNCAILIDANDKVYTVDLLREWKTKGEAIGTWQQHKCTILQELQHVEELIVQYDTNITRERDELSLYEDRMESEVDSLSNQVNVYKQENECLHKEIADLREELAVKDKYIINIIQAKTR